MSEKKQRVVVLGASDNPVRYANKAVRLLIEHGHDVVPINPRLKSVEGIEVRPDLTHIDGTVDTLSIYVSPEISAAMAEQILALQPARVIFNPGSENPAVRKALNEMGVRTEESCTLVLLRTGVF